MANILVCLSNDAQVFTEEQQQVVKALSPWGSAVLQLDIDKMAFATEAMLTELNFLDEFNIQPGTMVRFTGRLLHEYNDNP